MRLQGRNKVQFMLSFPAMGPAACFPSTPHPTPPDPRESQGELSTRSAQAQILPGYLGTPVREWWVQWPAPSTSSYPLFPPLGRPGVPVPAP